MKITIEFNIPDEREEFELAVNAGKTQAIIDDLDNYLRGQIKYNDTLSDELVMAFEDIRGRLHGEN